jgi:arylsulfatase K
MLLLLSSAAAGANGTRPNFVWLHVESTDGRAYQDEAKDLVPIPRIRSLMKRGANFRNAYCNVPICCPSRASVWAGREQHNMPHVTDGLQVAGAWNNYEGFGEQGGAFDTMKISDRLADANYSIRISGKEDWLTGGHSLNTMIDSFSIYARWPYDIPAEGGFHLWGDCGGNVTVNQGNQTAHGGDWKTLRPQTAWLRDSSKAGAAAAQPFFFYQGMNIVHPPYHTDEAHLARIPETGVVAPEWPPLENAHPCDLQVSMKKGCAIPRAGLNTSAHKVAVRRAYNAMIAEFDDMVGHYIDAVEDGALTARTVFVVSSDHGDMQLEHQQFYKMSAFEASTRVPIVVAGPGVAHVGDGNVHTLVTLVDLMPTFLHLAGVQLPPRFEDAPDDPTSIDGYSLVPLLQRGDAARASHADHVISQFHGETAGMSWFMLRKAEFKLVVWGSGAQHHPQLFNLTADPDEWNNLALDRRYASLVAELDAVLRKKVDYPAVAQDVAEYNLAMARKWMKREPHWRGVLGGTQLATVSQPIGHDCSDPKNVNLCELQAGEPWWGNLWKERPAAYQAAWDEWIAGDGELIPKCPSGLVHNSSK